MSEQPVTQASAPPSRAGKKTLGMGPQQWIIVLGVALAGGAYLLYRRNKAAKANAAANTQTNPSGCPEGTAPDAQGNCVQISQDYSGQLGTLQTEIADLQSSGATTSSALSALQAGEKGEPPPGSILTKLPAPSGLHVTNVTKTTATVAWNKVPGATSYQFAIAKGSGAPGPPAGYAVGGNTSHTARNLSPRTHYTVHVSSQPGGPSAAVAFTTK